MKIELVRSLEWQRAARGTTSPKTQLHAFKLNACLVLTGGFIRHVSLKTHAVCCALRGAPVVRTADGLPALCEVTGQGVPPNMDVRRLALLLACGLALPTSSLAAVSWDGTYFDPDDLKITVKRTGSAIVAHSDDWEISGTLASESRARLAGLDGVLGEDGGKITWSNGVTWSRKEAATLQAPPEWKGRWHGEVNQNDISLWLTSPTRVVAEGIRNGKKWKAEGHISGDTIYLFGISGKVHSSQRSAAAIHAHASHTHVHARTRTHTNTHRHTHTRARTHIHAYCAHSTRTRMRTGFLPARWCTVV